MFQQLSKMHHNFMLWFNYASRTFKNDYGFILACVSLASACSYFPYYVHNNADQFGPPRMAFSGKVPGDLETNTQVAMTRLSATRFRLLRAEVNGSGPTFGTDRTVDSDATEDLDIAVDPITTASIKPTEPNSSKLDDQVDGQVPIQKLSFDLIFASSGHGLIQDGDDILPVSRGSRLPDGSTVRSVKLREGQWQLVTSKNAILTVKN